CSSARLLKRFGRSEPCSPTRSRSRRFPAAVPAVLGASGADLEDQRVDREPLRERPGQAGGDARLAPSSAPTKSTSSCLPQGAPSRTPSTDARRGWRIDRAGAAPVDGVVALAMALDRAQHVQAAVGLLGWL